MEYSSRDLSYGHNQLPNCLAPFKAIDMLPERYNKDRAAAYRIIKTIYKEFYDLHSNYSFPCSTKQLCILLNRHITKKDKLSKQAQKVLHHIFKWKWRSISSKKIPKEELRQLVRMECLTELYYEEIKHPTLLSKILIKAAGADFISSNSGKKTIGYKF